MAPGTDQGFKNELCISMTIDEGSSSELSYAFDPSVTILLSYAIHPYQNRGIGKAICQVIASTNQEPLVLYAASRKGQDLGLTPMSPKTQLKYPQLDISDRSSIESLANMIQQEHAHVDVLINNAGVNLDQEYSPANVKTTLETNYRGTLIMCQTFIPLLTKDGRIVNVSSTGSSLSGYSKEIQDRFRNPNMKLSDLEQMMHEYKETADRGTERQLGWKPLAYGVTKAAINAMTAVLARENPGLTINACCPGWVDTDMGNIMGRPSKTPADGAKIPIRLGFMDINGVTGKYWGNASVSDRGDGEVRAW
ncbi:MAG: hypothetical protein Q9212_002713 [Teloschistes hypoglaucus]